MVFFVCKMPPNDKSDQMTLNWGFQPAPIRYSIFKKILKMKFKISAPKNNCRAKKSSLVSGWKLFYYSPPPPPTPPHPGKSINKNKFVTARVKIFLVTRICGNKSIIFFGLRLSTHVCLCYPPFAITNSCFSTINTDFYPSLYVALFLTLGSEVGKCR